jgi:hypothetical protein
MNAAFLTDAQWFERIGLPLDATELARLPALLAGPGAPPPALGAIAVIGSWGEAARIIDSEDRDSRRWDADEEERERMWELASERLMESELLALLQSAVDEWNPIVHDAAVRAARRIPIADPRFTIDATRAAQLAVHHSTLAALANADPAHPFHRTLELFARGRWPLGVSAPQFLLF